MVFFIIHLNITYSAQISKITPSDKSWLNNRINTIQREIRTKDNTDFDLNGPWSKRKETQKDKKESKNSLARGSGKCVNVKKVILTGDDNFSYFEKKKSIYRHLNKCISAADIENIMSNISQWYLDNGYITTRVYLEAQDLKGGVLKLKIVEGTVEKIILEDNGKNSIFIPTFFPGVVGKILNLRALEQAIDQANKLASNNAVLDIKPGSDAGKSIVVVKNSIRTPLHVNLSLDNYGSASTGKIKGAVTVTLDRLLGLNEMFTYTHRQSIPYLHFNTPGKSMSDSLNLIFPYGYFTYGLSFSSASYESHLTTPSGFDLIGSGSTDSLSFMVDRVMYRDKEDELHLSMVFFNKAKKLS